MMAKVGPIRVKQFIVFHVVSKTVLSDRIKPLCSRQTAIRSYEVLVVSGFFTSKFKKKNFCTEILPNLKTA